ncbi:alpha/beta hydrolase [Allorhodopirellula solitaria]|uniref:alpha/beta hydrolase n=1 Tax=Allorhodopirellula solitaria TaxID=2527987 RepID=UPI001FE4B4E1|nr:alpha/beta hydrolase [Allorhodopirellula solitaria]
MHGQTVASPLASVAAGASEESAERQLQATATENFDARALDQIWLVSSRRLGSRNASLDSLDIRRRVGGSCWQASSVVDFMAPDADGFQRPVVIFIHGNRWSLDKAIRRGLQTYNQTILQWPDAPPVRFVIWAWPADRIVGPIRDVRVKAQRADEHSFHLARFLQKMDPAIPVSIIGFSFGGRVALGALQLVGGGAIDGCGVPTAPHRVPPVNLALAVPAIRNDCLVTTHRCAYDQIKHLDLLYNNRDTYLSFYRFTRFDNRRPALGYTGVSGLHCLPDHDARVHQLNAARFVGMQHDYLEYITDHAVEAHLREHLLIGLTQ